VSHGSFTALVLAASRVGATDPLAQSHGVSHKCLVPVAGKPMVQRVIEILRATPEVGRIFVSIEDAKALRAIPDLAVALDAGAITPVPSAASFTDSIARAVAAMGAAPYPILITTADNALHRPEILSHFCVNSANAGDVAVAMTAATTVLAAYPHGQRAFHHFRDGAYSSCNLYVLRNAKALAAARAFAGGGQFAKKPWRILHAFGLLSFLLYRFRLLTLDQTMARLGGVLGVDLRAVILPFAEAPIDIDNAADLVLTEEILRGNGAPR
jgi:GTP:adenosylcobinamide-phosphate guanylyltransferase